MQAELYLLQVFLEFYTKIAYNELENKDQD